MDIDSGSFFSPNSTDLTKRQDLNVTVNLQKRISELESMVNEKDSKLKEKDAAIAQLKDEGQELQNAVFNSSEDHHQHTPSENWPMRHRAAAPSPPERSGKEKVYGKYRPHTDLLHLCRDPSGVPGLDLGELWYHLR